MKNTNRVKFFGDFTTGENYQAAYDFYNHTNALREKGYDYFMEHVKGFFENSFNIVNLESPITSRIKSPLENKKGEIHWMDSKIAPNFMKKYGIDAVSLGNNHSFDFETEGLKETMVALDSVGIKYFGAGFDAKSSMAPLKHTIQVGSKQLNLYVFGGLKYMKNYDEEFLYYAKTNKAGVSMLAPKSMNNEIKKIKAEDKNSFVVVYPHFELEYLHTIEGQIEYAHSWIDSGADLVIGHGCYSLNQIEYYKDKPIIYSLGAFVFPFNFEEKTNSFGAVFEIEFIESNGEIKPINRIYPLHIDNNSEAPLTYPLKDEELDDFISALTSDEKKLNEKLKIYKGCVYCIEL